MKFILAYFIQVQYLRFSPKRLVDLRDLFMGVQESRAWGQVVGVFYERQPPENST